MFRDGTKEGIYSQNVRPDFTEARDPWDLYTIKNKGTRDNPEYNYEPAATVDTMSVLNRALNKIVKSTYMDDYKAASVEQWIAQAGKYLRHDKSSIDEAPYYYFFTHSDTDWVKGTPWTVRKQLEAFRLNALQFIGEPSWLDSNLQAFSQAMSDATYGKKFAIDPWWMLPKVTDGARYARGVAFHGIMGVMNPTQLIIQSMTYTTIAGLAGPVRAAQGTAGAMLFLASKFTRDPKVIAHLDSLAVKGGGWRPGEWTEAMQSLERTGFQKVGSEHILKEIKPQVIPGTNLLDISSLFFTMGEKASKVGAWMTAYKEFRDVQPTGKLTNRNMQQILNRADILSGNMSTASKSMLEKGILSFPMQFASFAIRQSELMLGKTIPGQQKIRLAATQALLFGVPITGGLAGVPVGAYLRQKAIDNGYNVGENTAYTFFMEGAASLALAMIQEGTLQPRKRESYLNVGSRYASPGVDQIKDFLEGDKTLLELASGPTGSIIKAGLEGLSKSMRFAMNGVPLTTSDFIEPLTKIVASADKIKKMYYAINFHKWANRNEVYMDDVSAKQALGLTLSGLQPIAAADIHGKQETLKAERDKQLSALRDFTKELHRMFDNDLIGNKAQAQTNYQRAEAILTLEGYPREKRAQAYMSAIKSYSKSQVERVDIDYYLKKTNEERASVAREAYQIYYKE
jgi:hypothetical protein